jgi:hypothetical protein
MNNHDKSPSFIFFLCLGDTPSKSFYIFDKYLKELGFILVPVKVDQIQSLISASDQEQVIVLSSVSDAKEYKMYNEKVRGILKYILKSKRLTFMHLSSFSKLNDQNLYSILKNYFFMKYPINAKELCLKIGKYHAMKKEQRTVWPGGRRAGLGAGVV